MSYKDEIFTRYGHPSNDGEIKYSSYLTKPEAIKTLRDVEYNDKKAAEIIAKCKHLIDLMSDYRIDLATRYASLSTMTSKKIVELQRYNGYNGVNYYIRFWTEYEDGTRVETAKETYTGKERHTALKRFEELKKAHPGFEYIKDISKKAWER